MAHYSDQLVTFNQRNFQSCSYPPPLRWPFGPAVAVSLKFTPVIFPLAYRPCTKLYNVHKLYITLEGVEGGVAVALYLLYWGGVGVGSCVI